MDFELLDDFDFELLEDFDLELLEDFDLEPELLLRLLELELFFEISPGFFVDKLMSSDFGGKIGSQTSD